MTAVRPLIAAEVALAITAVVAVGGPGGLIGGVVGGMFR